jgi:hypothetical protein
MAMSDNWLASAYWESADLPAQQVTGAAIRAAARPSRSSASPDGPRGPDRPAEALGNWACALKGDSLWLPVGPLPPLGTQRPLHASGLRVLMRRGRGGAGETVRGAHQHRKYITNDINDLKCVVTAIEPLLMHFGRISA